MARGSTWHAQHHDGFVGWFARSYPIVIVALVAIMAVMMVVLALQQVSASRPAAGAEPGPIPTFENASDTRPVAAFLGDSYTAGKGSSSTSHRWTSLVAKEQNWREINDGDGGTGYSATASQDGCGKPFCDNYAGRVKDVVAQAPDIVIVAGGQNDFATFQRDADTVRADIAQTFTDLHAQLPDARIIAVGPSTTSAIAPQVTGLDAAVRDAAATVGAQYISLLDPNVVNPDWVLEDGGHVDDDGHAAIADRVDSALS